MREKEKRPHSGKVAGKRPAKIDTTRLNLGFPDSSSIAVLLSPVYQRGHLPFPSVVTVSVQSNVSALTAPGPDNKTDAHSLPRQL